MIHVSFSINNNEHISVNLSSDEDFLIKGIQKLSLSTPIKLEHLKVDEIKITYTSYPQDFMEWVKKNELRAPRIKSNCGQALALLLHNKNKFVTRQDLELFFKNLGRKCGDAIQTINKTEQWGLKIGKTGNKKGEYFISQYELGNKHLIRKDFKFTGSNEERNRMINAIKAEIKADYLDVPNDLWELGHKNPGRAGMRDNFVFQPPIQGRYRKKIKKLYFFYFLRSYN